MKFVYFDSIISSPRIFITQYKDELWYVRLSDRTVQFMRENECTTSSSIKYNKILKSLINRIYQKYDKSRKPKV